MDDRDLADTPKRASIDAGKRPYQAPLLEEWGTLKELTQKVGYMGNSDGGKFPLAYRTHF
jgi:hypothetical protein